jgi:hypothetical protein
MASDSLNTLGDVGVEAVRELGVEGSSTLGGCASLIHPTTGHSAREMLKKSVNYFSENMKNAPN